MKIGDSLGKNKKMIAIIVVIIIIIAIVGFSLSRTVFDSHEDLKAVAQADKTIARMGEAVNFTSEKSKGTVVHYNWDFGDGNTSVDSDPSHIYENSGWYNATLLVVDDNGNKDNATIVIGVQANNVFKERSEATHNSLRPRTTHHFICEVVDIGPSIGLPTVEIQNTINQPIGSIIFKIEVSWMISMSPDGMSSTWQGYIIHTEEMTVSGNDINWDYTVQPEDFPEEVQTHRSDIRFSVMNDIGHWDSAECSMSIVFPMENLSY